MLYKFLPIGDFSSGLFDIFSLCLFALLFVIYLIVISIIDLRKGKKFDFIPLILSILFIFLMFRIFGSGNPKFWTKKILTAEINEPKIHYGAVLRLYKNNSFATVIFSADYSNTYQGCYEIINNTLTLKRKDLIEITDSIFYNKYKIERNDSLLIPLNSKFSSIQIIDDKW